MRIKVLVFLFFFNQCFAGIFQLLQECCFRNRTIFIQFYTIKTVESHKIGNQNEYLYLYFCKYLLIRSFICLNIWTFFYFLSIHNFMLLYSLGFSGLQSGIPGSYSISFSRQEFTNETHSNPFICITLHFSGTISKV